MIKATVIISILIALLIFAGIKEHKEFEQFLKDNNCKEAGYISSSIGTGVAPVVGGNGGVAVVTTYAPKKTRYVCDNDVEIYD